MLRPNDGLRGTQLRRAPCLGVSCVCFVRGLVPILLMPLISGCIVFPLSMVERPEISGTVINVKGIPISEAKISIIGSRTRADDHILEDYEVSFVRSDSEGQFKFGHIKRIDWVHGYKFLARSPCARRLEVEAQGYETRMVRLKYEGEYNQLSDDTCRNVEFNVEVVLFEQLTRQEKTPSARTRILRARS